MDPLFHALAQRAGERLLCNAYLQVLCVFAEPASSYANVGEASEAMWTPWSKAGTENQKTGLTNDLRVESCRSFTLQDPLSLS